MIDTRITVEEINARSLRNMGETLGIEFTEINEGKLYKVAVFYREAKIGFVPQHTNLPIAQLLQRGKPIKAKVAKVDPSQEPWARIYMQVLMEDDETSVA